MDVPENDVEQNEQPKGREQGVCIDFSHGSVFLEYEGLYAGRYAPLDAGLIWVAGFSFVLR
jgi:hypothetical protein